MGVISDRHKMFVEEYLANGYHALAAYKKVYGTDNRRQPYDILKKPEVQEYINERRKEYLDSLKIDQMRVMQELSTIAFDEKHKDQLKALNTLVDVLGMKTQKVDIKQEVIEVGVE